MYPPSQDAVFARSVSGKIWPRAAVAAGSYWHFTNASFDTLQPDFDAVTATLVARGVDACPANCTCSELKRCGVPYPGAPPPSPRPPRPSPPPSPPSPPAPKPPASGVGTYTRTCDAKDSHQRISFAPQPAGSATGQLRNARGLCVDSQDWDKHAPLGFFACDTKATQLWLRNGTTSTFEQTIDGRPHCLDSFGLRGGKYEVGVFPCARDGKEKWSPEAGAAGGWRDGYDSRCLSDQP